MSTEELTQPELPSTPDVVDNPAGNQTTANEPAAAARSNYIIVGLDLGTNTSCIQAVDAATSNEVCNTVVPTIVGYADRGILAGILPDDSAELFGTEALRNELHLRISRPLKNGVIEDVDAASKFVKHLRDIVDPEGKATLHAVVGIPSNADEEAKENVQKAVSGIFDSAILVPEPFLAAYGFRDESRLKDPEYVDPVKNSLFIDIGAGTTDYCIIQGYFPTPEDQLSMPIAGENVDERLEEGLAEAYPDTRISPNKVREYKEKYSYVGEPQYGMKVRVPVGGKPRTIEIGKQIGEACNMLLENVFQSLEKVIPMARPDSVFELLQNIILTGGGSMIENMPEELQRLLLESGYENPRVLVAGQDFKTFVANGALKVALAARPEQWANSKV
jgi:rod shape-determining protein MreB and related proteins